MIRLKTLATLFAMALVAGTFQLPAKADEWNKKTVVTFNEPVEIPGRVLPAGTYVFKLMDSESDRNIVQIFNKDEDHLYATILAIPDYRLQPTGKTVLQFEERAAGSPEAIRAWFYPGDQYGDEFVYPKPKATELAKQNNKPVLSMPAEMTTNIVKPAKTVQESSVVAMKKAPVMAVKPTGEEVEIVEVVTPAPTQIASAKRLPKTASQLPLLGLIGLCSIGAAGLIRLISKRIS